MSSDGQSAEKTTPMAPAVSESPPPAAVLSCVGPPPPGTTRDISLVASAVSFGRDDNHDVVLKVEGVSRNHARIYPGNGTWGVEDLGSTNGVYVNKSKIEQVWLNPGDILSLGKVHYKYALVQARPSALELNISGSDKTMVMRPGSESAAHDVRDHSEGTTTATPPRSAPKDSAHRPHKKASSPLFWFIVAGVAIVLAAVAFSARG